HAAFGGRLTCTRGPCRTAVTNRRMMRRLLRRNDRRVTYWRGGSVMRPSALRLAVLASPERRRRLVRENALHAAVDATRARSALSERIQRRDSVLVERAGSVHEHERIGPVLERVRA